MLEIPKKWDYEAEVIIVGAGTAGLPAAVAAINGGAKKVAVLELMSYCAASLALVNVGPAFAGTDMQKAEGIDDSAEIYYQDGTERGKGVPELWKAFTDNQLSIYNWTKEIGVQYQGLFAMPAHTRKRGIFVKGNDMLRCIEKAAKAKGAEILFLHRATRLIIDPATGRVLGLKVRVKDEKEEKNFKAEKAVILTTGGFGRNKAMIEEFGPSFKDWVPTMCPGHLGDGLKMALAVGAATKDFGRAVSGSFAVDAETKTGVIDFVGYAGGVMVNVKGQRFWEEATRNTFYGQVTEEGMKQPGGVFYCVLDDKARKNIKPGKLGKAKPYQADTLDELCKTTGINAAGLKATIEKYNADIKSVGYDTVFDRRTLEGCEGTPVTIDTPPYYAIKCKGSISSFKGGIKINANAQVINQYEEVIPGLYAAGELTGGLWGAYGTYLPGTMVSASMTFGMIAGKNAVKEKTWSK
jgi:fumarate reductase flavoprotein subunit